MALTLMPFSLKGVNTVWLLNIRPALWRYWELLSRKNSMCNHECGEVISCQNSFRRVQSSVIEPLLFCIYVNNLEDNLGISMRLLKCWWYYYVQGSHRAKTLHQISVRHAEEMWLVWKLAGDSQHKQMKYVACKLEEGTRIVWLQNCQSVFRNSENCKISGVTWSVTTA